MIGLLLTGGLYAAFAPATAEQQQTDIELAAQGRELFIVGCSFCTGRTVRASSPGTAPSSSVRAWSESARPPSTSRSAPAGCPP